MDRHGHRLQLHWLAFARQFIRWTPRDLLRRNGRRNLLDLPAEPLEQGFERLPVERNRDLWGSGHAVHVVAVGGVSEVDNAFVDLVVARKELGEASGAADHEWQDAGRPGVKGPEVSNLARARQTPHLVDYVM